MNWKPPPGNLWDNRWKRYPGHYDVVLIDEPTTTEQQYEAWRKAYDALIKSWRCTR